MGEAWPRFKIDDIKAPTPGSLVIGPFGSRMKADRYTPSGIAVIRGTNIGTGRSLDGEFVYISEETAQEFRNCIVEPGDLVFPHRGSIGEVAIVTGPPETRLMISTSLMKLSCDRSRVDPAFVFYFFRTPEGRHELLKNASQVGTPGIATPLTSLRNIVLPLPPLPAQRAIAGVLGALDDKIEVNRRMARTLEAAARALFESWFVRFEHPASKATAPQTIDSPLRPKSKVPDGWHVMTPWEAFEVNPPRTLPRDSDAAYLDMSNMPTQGHTPESWVRRAVGSGMKFMNGDTLVARITPCLENGKTAFVDFLEDREVGWGSTEYIVMRPKKPLPLVFAYCLARSDEFRTFAIRQMSGSSGRQRVPAESLRQFFLAVPPATIAEEFGRVVEPIFGRIKTAMEQTRAISAMRDALLPKLISGELPVPEAVGRAD